MKPTSVFVGGLGADIQKEDLEREFTKFGTLNKVWVARNPPGFAFIEFDDDQDANDAIQEMNGATINGSQIRVDLSRGDRNRRGGDRRGGRGGFRSGGNRFGGGNRSFGGGNRSFGGGNRSFGGDGGYRGGSGYRSRSPMGRGGNNWN